ncbi:small nuclear ribonucleoprotein G-like [Fukomys damarensis]|uniref:small nuclear ribonucleoprotein G-like n=1 Tax=Fukomys damarensis TaxID=885580 RepID=UPI00145506FB|nr:small nuclear ribonucleoprotein G-like [Fukomys damarensis]
MSKAHPPELKVNDGRHFKEYCRKWIPVTVVTDEYVEMAVSGQQNNTGMVVLQGNSIVMLEALESLMTVQ